MNVFIIEAGPLGVLGAYSALDIAQLWLIEEAKRRGFSVQWHDDEKRSANLDNGLFTVGIVACIVHKVVINHIP